MKKKRLLTAVCTIALAAATVGVFTPKVIDSLKSVDTIQAGADATASVKISVSDADVKPGGDFELKVDISGVPSSGVNCCELGIQFNSSVVTVSNVKKGDLISAIDENELYISGNTINLGYASIDGVIKKDGTLLVIEGKASATAKAGDKSNFKITPINRAVTPGSSTKVDSIYVGYAGDDNVVNSFKASTVDGLVTIVDTESTKPATTKATDKTTVKTDKTTVKTDKTTVKTDKTTVKTTAKTKVTTTKKTTMTTWVTTPGNHPLGDVTLDSKVSVSDIVLLQNYLVNNYKFGAEQAKLADINGDGKVNVFDAVALRRMLLKK